MVTAKKYKTYRPPARKRKQYQNKIKLVMAEFKAGKLRHGMTGQVVTDPKMAIAIALSEGRRATSKKKRSRKGRGYSRNRGAVRVRRIRSRRVTRRRKKR